MMALDAKSIKEEISDKDAYDTTAAGRRTKGKESSSRSTDSPDSVRAVAPRSPLSPVAAQSASQTLAPPRGHHRHRSVSPLDNGGSGGVGVNGATGGASSAASTTSPLASPGISSAQPQATTTPQQQQQQQQQHQHQQQQQQQQESSTRTLAKVRRFLGALVQFGQDTSAEMGDRVRALILSLASGGMTADEFKLALQEATNFPLRSYVLPFLKTHVPYLQRDIAGQARACNQTPGQFVRSNETSIIEFVHPAEHTEIFLPLEPPSSSNGSTTIGSGREQREQREQQQNGSIMKRRASESYYDHPNGAAPHDWTDYMLPAKRHHLMLAAAGNLYGAHVPLFDYQQAATAGLPHPADASAFAAILEKSAQREERASAGSSGGGSRSAQPQQQQQQQSHSQQHQSHPSQSQHQQPPPQQQQPPPTTQSQAPPAPGSGGEEEWKNIYTMLNCISAMVDKTKRAITILQQRGNEPHPSTVAAASAYHENSLADLKRQTEEKVAEFRRNAEDAVQQVKRQAMMEIQRAVVAAESRAIETMAAERLKMEKIFAEIAKNHHQQHQQQQQQQHQHLHHAAAAAAAAEADVEVQQQQPTSQQQQHHGTSAAAAGAHNVCWNCGRKANETCSGCNLARYCGSFCQHKDWEQHHHICGNSRVDAKHAPQQPPHFRSTVPPTRTSPNQSQQQSQQQQPPTSSSNAAAAAAAAAASASAHSLSNGVSTVVLK